MGCGPSKGGSGEPSTACKALGDFREEMVWERSGRSFEEVYETLEKLGCGAFASVALIKKRPSGNRSLQRSSSDSDLKAAPRTQMAHLYVGKFIDFRGRGTRSRVSELRHEIDVLRRVDHPNVVHLREAFWEPSRLVLVMEYCEGRELGTLAGTLDEAELQSVSEQILRAVAYLHANGVVHRDLKLENVMAVDEGGGHLVVKIIDFGLSRVCGGALDASGHGPTRVKAAGTMSTAAPEVVRGGEYVGASDVFSVGCMVFKLVTKKNAFLDDDVDPTAQRLAKLNAGECDWSGISHHSKPCREFLYRCFRPAVDRRWTAEDALRFAIDAWRPAVVALSSDDDDRRERPVPAPIDVDGASKNGDTWDVGGGGSPRSRASSKDCGSPPGTPGRLAPEMESSLKPGQEKGATLANFKGSSLGRFPLVSADSSTSDHLSKKHERCFWNARARNAQS